MWTHHEEFRAFYQSRQGELPLSVVSQAVREFWPDVRGCRVAALGYGSPFLEPLSKDAHCILELHPEPMGTRRADAPEPARAALVDAAALPLPDRSIDRLMLVHIVEYSENLNEVLRDCWRVLTDHGSMILVAPNRAGLWCRLGSQPFARGRAPTKGGLEKTLSGALFRVARSKGVLYAPPIRSFGPLAPAFERIGERLGGAFGGAFVLHCVKEMAVPVLRATESSRDLRERFTAFGPLGGVSGARGEVRDVFRNSLKAEIP